MASVDDIKQPVEQPRIGHTLVEDALAIIIGTLMVSFGVVMLRQVGALTGGTAGMAFLAHYVTQISFGTAFFIINLPFYYLSFRRMGLQFTLKTFAAVALVSVFSDLHPLFVHFDHLQPFYATLFANVIMGIGFIVLFRHKASLGGVNILALFLQDKYGIRAGKLQMGVDCCIVLASLGGTHHGNALMSAAGLAVFNGAEGQRLLAHLHDLAARAERGEQP